MDSVEEPRLGAARKLVIGLGDHTITLSLASLSLFYVFFLTEHVGLRPALAGAVPLVGRFVDALTDPLMGRISDQTRWRWGRRRPYMLLGALPFGASFAALWLDAPVHTQLGMFAYYSGAYIVYSVASRMRLAACCELLKGTSLSAVPCTIKVGHCTCSSGSGSDAMRRITSRSL